MEHYLDNLPHIYDEIKNLRDILITNIVFMGQTPSPTFQEGERGRILLQRLSELNVDECAFDDYNNPIGVIRGTDGSKPPVFLVAHLDTVFDKDIPHYYKVLENKVIGPGVVDNSVGVGILASMPEIIRRLGLSFQSDIILAGVVESMGKGNLAGIRHLLDAWPSPIRGAICLEGGELGRLNYYSNGMKRCEIGCNVSALNGWSHRFKPNAILIINEIINDILKMPLPQRPRARVIIGKIAGGHKHGAIAYDAKLGFEIQSDSDEMVEKIFNEIEYIVKGYRHEYNVEMVLEEISNQKASRLEYNHGLVRSVISIMSRLGIEPVGEANESELSALLSRDIPAITLGLTRGKNIHQENSTIEIDPMFKGIAQVLGAIMAIDYGVCDE